MTGVSQSQLSASRFDALYRARRGREAASRRWLTRWRRRRARHLGDARFLREILLANIGRFPKSPRQIYADVRLEYGSLCERRFWRALRHHVKADRVRRIGGKQGDNDVAYVRNR